MLCLTLCPKITPSSPEPIKPGIKTSHLPGHLQPIPYKPPESTSTSRYFPHFHVMQGCSRCETTGCDRRVPCREARPFAWRCCKLLSRALWRRGRLSSSALFHAKAFQPRPLDRSPILQKSRLHSSKLPAFYPIPCKSRAVFTKYTVASSSASLPQSNDPPAMIPQQ